MLYYFLYYFAPGCRGEDKKLYYLFHFHTAQLLGAAQFVEPIAPR